MIFFFLKNLTHWIVDVTSSFENDWTFLPATEKSNSKLTKHSCNKFEEQLTIFQQFHWERLSFWWMKERVVFCFWWCMVHLRQCITPWQQCVMYPSFTLPITVFQKVTHKILPEIISSYASQSANGWRLSHHTRARWHWVNFLRIVTRSFSLRFVFFSVQSSVSLHFFSFFFSFAFLFNHLSIPILCVVSISFRFFFISKIFHVFSFSFFHHFSFFFNLPFFTTFVSLDIFFFGVSCLFSSNTFWFSFFSYSCSFCISIFFSSVAHLVSSGFRVCFQPVLFF